MCVWGGGGCFLLFSSEFSLRPDLQCVCVCVCVVVVVVVVVVCFFLLLFFHECYEYVTLIAFDSNPRTN